MLSALTSWATTLSLVFGGCCANALTLEQLTLTYPNFGSLITFLQFLLIALHGLPGHIVWTRFGPWLRPRRIPLLPYLGQVVLFYFISLLNNAAFGYRIPMPVHIIFRSGGLVVSMLFGWLISRKRYNFTQVLSVMLVTVGVALTTLSASQPSSSKSSVSSDLRTYIQGIGLLSLALVLSGFLGLLQEWTYKTYGGPSTTSGSDNRPTWRESLFYLHFLALPLFYPLLPEIRGQIEALNHGSPRAETSLPLHVLSPTLLSFFPSIGGSMPPIPPPFRLPSLDHIIPQTFRNNTFIYFSSVPTTEATTKDLVTLTLSLPKPYLPLLANTLTQLLCVAGVHRLTTRVSNLTVTLILVVRKAVSLVISLKGRVLWKELTRYSGVNIDSIMQEYQLDGLLTSAAWFLKVALGVDDEVVAKRAVPMVDEGMLWTGAALVLAGTIGYTIGTGFRSSKGKAQKKAKKE